jgi:predicted transcriptional regulator
MKSRASEAMIALDDHFLDLAVVDVADGALDQIAVRMDQRRSRSLHRAFADLVPQAGEIVEVALDLGLGALQAGGAHDAAHALGQVHFGDDRLQALAVGNELILREMPPPWLLLGISTQ